MLLDEKSSRHVMLAEFDGDSMLLDTNSGQYYALNAMGSTIWKLAQAAPDRSAIVGRLVSEYDVSVRDAERDVSEFLSGLGDAGLLPA